MIYYDNHLFFGDKTFECHCEQRGPISVIFNPLFEILLIPQLNSTYTATFKQFKKAAPTPSTLF